MPNYLTPGVYVEEVPSGINPIGGVGTSTAAFVGIAPDKAARVNEPVACNNWTQFANTFASNGGAGTDLSRAVFGFFSNGGTRCYVVNAGDEKTIIGDPAKRTGLQALLPIDEVAIVAIPGADDPATHEALLSFCENRGDCVALLDPPCDVNETEGLKTVATVTSGGGGDGDDGGGGTRKRGGAKGALRPRNSDYGAFYFPCYQARDPLSDGAIVAFPPSGAMAGICARVDTTRGVHKAPANEVIRGALGLNYPVTKPEQGDLNRLGVNCIRMISGAIRAWGARTLAEEASEYRYLNVRRLLNFIEESIEEGTNWVVFEPNDLSLRAAVTQNIRSFLKLQWRAGALVGATPEQAFFVKCDAENNPPEVVDAGQLIVDIGVAPSKPAEFVIFRISQWAGGAQVEGAA